MPNGTRLTKDQQRANWAYKRAAEVARDKRDEYKTAVRALGADILRSGLSAALADLKRRKADNVLADIECFEIPVLRATPNSPAASLLVRVNELCVGQYMLATRETLQVVMWLKRACDALFEEEDPGGDRRREGDGHA
jgi:CRISPR-associated protein Cmr5